MRWLLATALLMVAAPAYAQENEAEKLFRAMEKKITSAKSLKVASEADFDLGGQVIKFKGSSQQAEGNKARVEFEGEIFGTAFKMSLVSDGAKMLQSLPPGLPGAAAPEVKKTPDNLNKMLAGVTARAGVMAASGVMEKDDPAQFDIDKKAPVSDFKMGPKEKVGNVDTQVIEYTFKPDNKDIVSVTLWLDTKTNLPVKRLMLDQMKKEGKILETYTEFVIDPQLDAKVFELPK
jgi:outer membrane lipoprotein-sorting protein